MASRIDLYLYETALKEHLRNVVLCPGDPSEYTYEGEPVAEPEDDSNETASNELVSGTATDVEQRDLKVYTKRKRKFIVGRKYGLRIKSVDGSEDIFFKFTLIKTINAIRGQEVGILIMKASDVDREYMHKHGHKEYCLNKTDCLKYHIKYTPHLEVYSNELNWIECKD